MKRKGQNGGGIVSYPYRELALGVILQAVEDYRKLLAGQRPIVDRSTQPRDLEEFFCSGWFYELSNGVDGLMVMTQLQDEAEAKAQRLSEARSKHDSKRIPAASSAAGCAN